jgi:hypothetical protein
LPANLIDTNPGTPALDPDCQVVDTYVDAQNHVVSTPLQSCITTGGTAPCWQLFPDATRCGGPGLIPAITRDPTMQIPNGLSTTFSCAECVAGQFNPACP